MIKVKVPREGTPPHELPAELAIRSREQSRSMIKRILVSYICRKRGITGGQPEPPPRTVLFAAEPSSPGPSDLPPTGPQESEGHQSQDLDVTMAESTVAFGETV